jgi:hypothetical protein
MRRVLQVGGLKNVNLPTRDVAGQPIDDGKAPAVSRST